MDVVSVAPATLPILALPVRRGNEPVAVFGTGGVLAAVQDRCANLTGTAQSMCYSQQYGKQV